MSQGSPASVVVVGGGYAGIVVAKALDDLAQVTLVDPRDAFVHNIAALRAVADPAWLPRIFFPYDRLLTRGRFVRARATRVEPGRVTLSTGDALPADFIVLATGSTYPFPAKSDADSSAEAQTRYRAVHEALGRARRVLLLGAGPVGIELAGEILNAWPDHEVTIVDPADDILAGPFNPALRQELRSQLTSRGVRLLLGTTLRAAPPTPPGTAQSFSVETGDGRELHADIWFRCYGTAPVSDYLGADLAAARTADGFIRVTPQLQVSGHDRVFAIGDVAAADAKMGGRAHRQAEVAAANIRAMISGGALTAYEPVPPVILVPFGPGGGASQLPGNDSVVDAATTAAIKGRTLFTERYAEMFGAGAANPS